MQLKGKVALVTGASSGIGKCTAELFAKEGSRVILLAKEIDKLKSVQDEIEKNNGKADSFSVDITNRTEIKETMKKIIEKHGRIDILVNNAGIARWGSIEDVSCEDFDEQVKVNLIGCFNCIKAVVPFMVNRKSGSIINIITSTVKNTKAKRVAYAASKYGQAGLSNAVHEDLKDKGISVIAIYPGKTDTPLHDIPMDDPIRKKMLDPMDVAKIILKAALIPASEDVKELVISPPS